MIIEDEELRITFKIASLEHLQKLDNGLLSLEKHPEDQHQIEEMMREAHSLKGDAGMLGVKDVATLAHQWEHLLGSVKRKDTALTPEICDRLYNGLDAIRKLVHEAVTGEAANVNTFYVLAHLMGAPPMKSSAPPKPAEELRSGGAQEQGSSVAGELACDVRCEIDNRQSLHQSTPAPEYDNAPNLGNPVLEQDSQILAASGGSTSQPHPEVTNGNSRPPVIASRAAPEIPSPPSIVTRNFASVQSQNKDTGYQAPAPEVPSPKSVDTQHSTTNTQQSTVNTKQSSANGTYRIETIRVETRNLDTLMTQTGELTVTKIRFGTRLAEVEEIVALWEEWSRDAFVNRFALEEIGRGDRNSSLQQVQNFHHRLEERLDRLGSAINRLRNSVYEDTTRLDIIADELEEGIRTLRLLPLATIFNLFPRMVRDLARQQDKQVELEIEGGETRADKRILEEMKDPLMHMIRNAIDHGIETPAEREQLGKPPVATIRLRGYQTATNIVIEVIDDGRGLDIEKIKQTALKRGLYRAEELAAMTPGQIQSLIFAPGFSTRTIVTEVSGRGVGLDVVRTNVEYLKGSIHVESTQGMGCTLRVMLGTTLATAHVLLVSVNGIAYALPVEFVQTARLVPQRDIFTIECRETIIQDGQPVSVAPLAELLELPSTRGGAASLSLTNTPNSVRNAQNSVQPCIILKVGDERLGLLVDALLDEQDVVLKPQSKLLQRVRNVSGATILGTGEVCMVLNPQDLIESVRKQTRAVKPAARQVEEVKRKQVILLVEDSIATRTQEKRILEGAGYEVVTAVDGLDGYNKLKTRSFNAVVSDVQMPNLDGLGLAARIREHKEYSELPIILVTSLASDADRRRGAEAGANAYITKSTFNQEVLLETLKRLV